MIFKKVLLFLSLSATLALMAVIFNFSSEPAKVSDKTSKNVTTVIVKATVPEYHTLPSAEQEKVVKKYDDKIRSLAHFTEYTLLGFFAFADFLLFGIFKKKSALLALMLCLVYSLSDEIHQIFVPGRSFQVTDILTDLGGVLLGIIVLFALTRIFRRKIKFLQ